MAFKKYDSSYKRTESPFTNITDPGKLKKFKKELKPTRKRILSSTQTPSGMMTEYSKADDIVYTAAVSGVNANFLKPSLEAMGITEDMWKNSKKILNQILDKSSMITVFFYPMI